ncbi:MAG TPA: Hsp20/alpha crystallin family protein [Patescibacteria group bacterium]|nr:Hsp20/alpha crystallin family protein [Patescibacteria group bacterium]
MANTPGEVVSTNFWRVPVIASDLMEDLGDLLPLSGTINGLSISEDSKNVYVDASVPGIDPQTIDVRFDKGVLWIKAEQKKEEKEGKRYYRKASSSFSYRVVIPGEVDWKTEPNAVCKNGVMEVTFSKSPKSQPKKIAVKAE